MAKQDIPVYLFFGFLDGGKTTFIQSTLEDKRFNAGEKTLLLLCEEGEEEYDSSSFSAPNVYQRTLSDESELTEERLDSMVKETGAVRVVVEYNGLWQLQSFFDAMPEEWIPAQMICFAEASTFSVFNANMRNLVYDKLQNCEVIVFNRCTGETDTDTLHKIVRQANRRCNIFYEHTDGKSYMDQKEDPLPFDVDAPVIEIEDRDYAYFYADLMENMEKYEGKTVAFTGIYPGSKKPLPDSVFVAGRMLMNCCAEDTQFAGLACHRNSVPKPAPGSWFRVTGKVRLQRNRMFSGKVPVLDVLGTEKAREPEEPVATFY